MSIDRPINPDDAIRTTDKAPDAVVNETEAKDRDFDEKELISSVHGEIEDIISSRSTWSERQTRYWKLRYQVRPAKSWPWPGCSNISLPVVDGAIRKLMPSYVNLIWGPEETWEFKIPDNQAENDTLKKEAEYNTQMLNHVVRERMDDSFIKSVLLTDRMLQCGWSVVKVTYDYQTEAREYTINLDTDLTEEQAKVIAGTPQMFMPEGEKMMAQFILGLLLDQGCKLDPDNPDDMKQLTRAAESMREGKRVLKFKIDKIVRHAPKWTVVKPVDFIVHGGYNHIQEAQLVCHRMYWTANDLKIAARSGRFGDKGADVVQKICDRVMKNKRIVGNRQQLGGDVTKDDMDQALYSLTGSMHYGYADEFVEIREVGFYAMPDDSGILRRCVMVYCPEYPEEYLKFVVLPYDDNKWPYVRFCYEQKDDGFLSPRGVPCMLDYLATTINVRHNQMSDNITLSNAPMVKYIPGKVSASNVRYIPGQGVPVQSMDSLEPVIINAGNLAANIEEIRELRAWAESYVASPDFGIMQPDAPASSARTATEIVKIDAQREQSFTLDTRIFLDSLKELGEMTWMRWLQYGDEEYEIKVKGEKNPIRWRRDFGMMDFAIKCKGTLQGTNPALRIRKTDYLLPLAQHPIFGPMLRTYDILEYRISALAAEEKNMFMRPKEEWVKQNQQVQASIAQQQKDAFAMKLMEMKAATEGYIAKIKATGEQAVAEELVKGSITQKSAERQAKLDTASKIITERDKAKVMAKEKPKTPRKRKAKTTEQV